MFTKVGILFGLMLLAVRPAAAAMADYIPAFEINLEEDELPTMSELEAFFRVRKVSMIRIIPARLTSERYLTVILQSDCDLRQQRETPERRK